MQRLFLARAERHRHWRRHILKKIAASVKTGVAVAPVTLANMIGRLLTSRQVTDRHAILRANNVYAI